MMKFKVFKMVTFRMILLDCHNCLSKKMLLFLLVLLCWTLSIAKNDCQRGYQTSGSNNDTCTDINECLEGGHRQCGQLCTNTQGSYHCSCLPGYELEADKWSCAAQAPDAYIMFSHGQDISRMDQGGLNLNPVLQEVGDVIAFDYHYSTKSLFWIDGRQDLIGLAPLEGGETQTVLTDLDRPRHLAVDWIHHHIYWTDSKTRQIERVELLGTNREVIVQTGNRRPNCIAVDPFQGVIFWSTSGRRPRLERSHLNGSDYQNIVKSGLQDIVSITVDIIDKRVFWLDNGLSSIREGGRIESVDYSGEKREVVWSGPSNDLYGLSVFTDHVYWTELTTQTLSRANKYTGQGLVMLRSTYLDTNPKSISVVHPLKQPSREPTAAVNCSTDEDCPLVISVSQPAEAKPFLVIANQQDIQRINFDGTDYVLVAIGDMENLVAMDYDVRDEMVYYADQGRSLIGRVSITDASIREVVIGPEHIGTVEGIAIDWMRRRLYWTDSGRQTISTCSVDGGSIEVIVENDLHHPKAIAVHPALNLVYWSDTAEPAKIEAVQHDGSHRVTVALNVSEPNSLAIDYMNNQLIWLDSARLTIELANLDGTYRSVMTGDQLGQPYAVADFGDYVWFTEWEENMLVQVDKRNGEKRVRLRGSFNKPSGIQVVHPKSKQIGKINPCMVFNGGCEQICLVAHVNQVICSCDSGYNLRDDGVSCSMDECWTGQAKCHPHAICVDKEEGYDCHCEPGYLGDGFNCSAPTTPSSHQLIGPDQAAVTVEPLNPTSTQSVKPEPSTLETFISANQQRSNTSATATESGFEPVITMSSKKKVSGTGSRGSLTPRRSTTAAPRISTTGPPKGRRPGSAGTAQGTNKGGNKPNGSVTNTGTANGKPTNGGQTNNGTGIKIGGSGGANGGSGGANGGSGGANGGQNTNQNGNNGFDTSGIGNLFPGVAGGPAVTIGYRPTDSSHFGICPSEYKYYCLNGGECTWIKKLEKPSCRCLPGYAGERCLWVEPSYKSGINGATMAAISGGILLPLIVFVLIVAFILYRKKKQGKLESIRRMSRPEITLHPINFNQSPSSQNNSSSGSSFCSSVSLSGGSRRSSICTALISASVEAETSCIEPHTTASQTRSDPTAPGSPAMVKASLARLSDPGGSSPDTKLIGPHHYQVPKRSNPAVMPKPQFKLAGGVAALARRQSQSESHEDNEEHTYSCANHYVDMNTQKEHQQQQHEFPESFTASMPRRAQTHKYMAMDYNYPTASLGRRKLDAQVLYVNTPKKSSSATQVYSSNVLL